MNFSQTVGRSSDTLSMDFLNSEGNYWDGTGGWRWISNSSGAPVATMDVAGTFNAKRISAMRRGDDYVGTYGTYETAAISWVKANWRPGVLGGDRPGVLGLDNASDLSAYSSRDSVGLYVENVGRQSIIVSNCTFTATRVTLGNPLSGSLLGALRPGMIIDTRHSQKYSGIITSWDPSGYWIDVSGWFLVVDRLNAGNPSAGQIPSGPQSICINPQTKTWAINVNTYVDGFSESGETVGIEMGLFNHKADFSYTMLESGNDTSNSYGYDAVSLGAFKTGWGFTARSANSRMWIGMEAFGMEYAGFVDSNNRAAVGNEAKYGFLAQSGANAAFGVMRRNQVQVFRVDGASGSVSVGTIPDGAGHRRNGTTINGTRNGVYIDGADAGGTPRVTAIGVDADVNMQVTAKGAGYLMIGRDANRVGFYGSAGVNKQTGVPATVAGIYAALVNVGLISS